MIDVRQLLPHIKTNLIGDGYHTFGELYEHRISLWVALARGLARTDAVGMVWRSLKHSDGSSFEGWFVLGYGLRAGEQITYHLPLAWWDECAFAATLDKGPEWDGHTPADVLKRLREVWRGVRP